MNSKELKLQHKILEIFTEHFFKREKLIKPSEEINENPLGTSYCSFEVVKYPAIQPNTISLILNIDEKLALKLLTNLTERNLLWKENGSNWNFVCDQNTTIPAALEQKLLYEKKIAAYTVFDKRKNIWSFVISIIALIVAIISLIVKS